MRALIFCGGDPVPVDRLAQLPAPDVVIAADSGVDHAWSAGVRPDVVIGDLDSASLDIVAKVQTAGARIERHPMDKDATDLELAFELAGREGAQEVLVVGGGGGRLDHLLTNVAVIADVRWSGLRVSAWMDAATVTVVRTTVRVSGSPGEPISLIPVHGDVLGVRTSGLRWTLDDEPLRAGSSRGQSNELCEPVAVITVAQGCLLVVQPGGVGGEPG